MNPTTHQLLSMLLKRPIAFHRAFADIAGSATAGLFLSQAWYWQQRTTDPDGFWHKTRDEWTEETALTRSEQERARKNLKSIKVLEEKTWGLPAKLYYRVDSDKLSHLVGYRANKLAGSCQLYGRIQPTVGQDPASLYKDTRVKETTTETTTENTNVVSADFRTNSGRDKIAAGLLDHLNSIAGRRLQPTAANLKHIKARLRDGATREDGRLVIDWYATVRLREWDDAHKYFKPQTIFSTDHFSDYLDRAKAWQSGSDKRENPTITRWKQMVENGEV